MQLWFSYIQQNNKRHKQQNCNKAKTYKIDADGLTNLLPDLVESVDIKLIRKRWFRHLPDHVESVDIKLI